MLYSRNGNNIRNNIPASTLKIIVLIVSFKYRITRKNQMKKTLLIIFDAEGATGITCWKDVSDDYNSDKPTAKLRKELGKDLSAVLKGAKNAGIKTVYLLDGHSGGENITLDDITVPAGLKIILKTESATTVKQYSKKADYAALVAMHGIFSSNDGEPPLTEEEYKKNIKTGLGHAFTFTIKKIILNEKNRGESVTYIHFLKDMNLPTIFISGTKAAIDDVKNFYPEIATVITKNGKQIFPPEEIRKKLAEKMKTAVENAEKNKDFVSLKSPKLNYKSFEIEFKKFKDKEHDAVIKKDVNAFRKLNGIQINDRKIKFLVNTNKPYLKIYEILSKAMHIMGITEVSWKERS